ncbi:hypothetical protein [Luteimonas lutimaris]|uniref:Uncharacterized protein n=1 Tax=Luteimonas lutimaris TaxID=698645 RepID=A0ABP7MDP1_9GAMM
MKRLSVFLLAAGFASLAFAQSQSQPVDETLQPGAAAIGTEASDAAAGDRNCLRQTGSLITAQANRKADRAGKSGKCVNAFGRAYDRDDIERTGATNTAEALRMLDPAIH